ncbi:MAG TPA: hypothetical protein VHU80_09835, partial [Polyangiaceae bacterium]|nr:hypothetical protein [Polyangiaceae bacterium]
SRSIASAVLVALAAASFAAPALADDATVELQPVQAPPAKVRPEYGYWSEGKPRWFVSSKSDLGTFYAKPYVSAGYGLPHWIWVGADLNAISTLEFGQVYGGVRASAPLFDLAFGARDTFAYQKPFLVPRASFRDEDVLTGPGSKARYWAWEAEAVGIVPLPYSAILVDYIAVKTLDVPGHRYFYDESYRAVIGKPFFQVLRVAAVARFLHESALKVGVLTEMLFSTGRGEPVYRLGPAAALQLTDHLEALCTLSIAVSSPDSLGLALGAYGLAGVRYRWATGEPAPKLPWQGPWIP